MSSDSLNSQGRTLSDALYANPKTELELKIELRTIDKCIYIVATLPMDIRNHVVALTLREKFKEERALVVRELEAVGLAKR